MLLRRIMIACHRGTEERDMRTSKQCMAAGILCVSVMVTHAAPAGDWPQWRGPERNGISKETGLLAEWPPEGPKLLWQAKGLGGGYSTPALAGDRLFLLASEGLEDELVKALDLKEKGRELWRRRIGKVGNPDQRPSYPAARSTPTVDGELLYALGSDGDLVALETSSGAVRWKKSLRADFAGEPGTWAYAESPLIDGDVLVCTPGGSQGTLVALRKRDGELLWRAAVPGGDPAGYASAIIVEAGGVKQYVQFAGKGLVGVEAKSGRFLWRYDRTAQGSPANIPTPVAFENYVYSGTGRGGGGLVKLQAAGGEFTAEQVYFGAKLPTSIGGAVRIGDYLYGTASQGLLCIEFASGQVKWEDRSVGPASICFADGRLYLRGENGDVALVEATPEGYRERGRFTPPGQPERGNSKAWAYPVVANGRLYLRDLDVLWCYDIQAPPG
jgi:outer membrane protein assembly factor BamB